MTQDELIDELNARGFRMGEIASMRWKAGLALSAHGQTLLVLPRVKGVDLVLTPLALEELINPRGALSVSMRRDGDRVAEYFYSESDASVHRCVLDVVDQFIAGVPIPNHYFRKMGIGRTEWARLHGYKAAIFHGKDRWDTSLEGEDKNEDNGPSMREIYDMLSNDDGQDVYLSDGMWLSADGTLEDRGH